MPRIPVHTLQDAPEPSRDALKGLHAKVGKVLNIHGEMAHSPAVLHAYVGIQQAIAEHGTLDARTREAIALTVAAVDHCQYCQSAHTLSAKAAGLSQDQTVAVRRGEVGFDPKLAALLSVVREAAANVGNVSQPTWQDALEAGWSDTELTEVSAHLALNLFTNYFNHLAETDLDIPAVPPL